MKLFIASLLAAATWAAAPALAEDARSYDNGPVWVVSNIQTKTGHFDDYMRYVATSWKAKQEDSRKRGWILGYKVLTAVDARDNDPDIYLMVEYKNMAAMDVSLDEVDAQTKKLEGSVVASNRAFGERDKLRALRGSIVTRELIFK